jgi:deazaflavin-dependent oxidoreductase (nitroreductase family)
MTDTRTVTADPKPRGTRAPWLVRASNPLTNRLMRLGLPMGPNVPLTVRGRTSGVPRTAPVAIVEIGKHRYVIGAYGDVQWVRNLRAAGEASIKVRGRDVHVSAAELDPAAARAFYADTLPGFIAGFPWLARVFAGVLFRAIAPDILRDPVRAAATRPVFELKAAG